MKNSQKLYSCIVLSGGESRRMGQDKGSMIIQDKPMILHILDKLNYKINDAVIVLNDAERVAIYEELLNQYSEDTIYERFDYELSFADDEIKDKGPLSGIMTGLKNIKTNYAIVLPCDSPFIEVEYICKMFELLKTNNYPDALIPFNKEINHEKDILNKDKFFKSFDFNYNFTEKENIDFNLTEEDKINQSEPLHSIYSKCSGLLIEDLIKKDNLFIKDFIRKINNKEFVLIDNELINEINFKNINRIEDLD